MKFYDGKYSMPLFMRWGLSMLVKAIKKFANKHGIETTIIYMEVLSILDRELGYEVEKKK